MVYATELKAVLAGVPGDLLAAHGPVSPETARALAEGVRERCGSTWGIGLTGVAGPDPVDGHGPGRVYLGVSDGQRTDVVELDLPGERADVRDGSGHRRRDRAARATAVTSGAPGNARSGEGVTPRADAPRWGQPWPRPPRTVSARRPGGRRRFPRSQDRRRP